MPDLSQRGESKTPDFSQSSQPNYTPFYDDPDKLTTVNGIDLRYMFATDLRKPYDKPSPFRPGYYHNYSEGLANSMLKNNS